MPRRRRPIVPGVPHHITQRAAHGRFILEGDAAKAVLASSLSKWCKKTGVIIRAFVFMDNHFHLDATPPDDGSLGFLMARVAAGFSAWLNAQRGDVGPNWQGAFYAAPMDDEHALLAARYIERNPIAAGLVECAWDYRWSSAAWHAGRGPKPELLVSECAPGGLSAREWRDFLLTPGDEAFMRRVRECTDRGTPIASEQWIEAMERRLGRQLRPKPVGRPRAAPIVALARSSEAAPSLFPGK